jgi:hypothetical protein
MGAIVGLMGSSAALAIVEKVAPLIWDAISPDVTKLVQSLNPGLFSVTPPDIDPEAAVAKLIQDAMPAISAAELNVIKNKIGTAVAVYATDPSHTDVTSDVAWVDISALAWQGIEDQGLDSSKIPTIVWRQMLSSGICMFKAGIGAQALSVLKSAKVANTP